MSLQISIKQLKKKTLDTNRPLCKFHRPERINMKIEELKYDLNINLITQKLEYFTVSKPK